MSSTTAKRDTWAKHKRKKKERLVETNDSDAECLETAECFFDKLPLEILAEVLILTKSPQDVLSVTRCSKFLCHTLVAPCSTFIWRTVRQECRVPPPPPISTFPEPAYAGLLFDRGECEVCKKKTNKQYISFAIRLRICKRYSCFKTWIEGPELADPSSRPDLQEYSRCVPYIENTNHPFSNPVEKRMQRLRDLVAESIDRGENATERQERLDRRAAYINGYMKFCKTLHRWKEDRQKVFLKNKRINAKTAQTLADASGWNVTDMMNLTPFRHLNELKNKRLEILTLKDYPEITSQIDKALVELSEDRKRKSCEVAYAKNRRDVAQHYQRLKSQQPHRILPSLPVFRQLSLIAMLQGHSPTTVVRVSEQDSKSVSIMLNKEDWVIARLNSELKNWVEQAERGLGAVLGFPNWSTANKKIPHPVNRVSARFLCKTCSKVANHYEDDRCLDFRGACEHACIGIKQDKKHEGTWSADKFVKDDTAIEAIMTLLKLCNVDAFSEQTSSTFKNLGNRILCTSCESGLLMNSDALIGHSHRHEHMQMRLVSEERAAKFLTRPPLHHHLRSLRGHRPRAISMRNAQKYGCRHCYNLNAKLLDCLALDQQTEDKVANHSGKEPSLKGNKNIEARFTFDGMHCHLKAKHRINDPRDEDMFVSEEAASSKS